MKRGWILLVVPIVAALVACQPAGTDPTTTTTTTGPDWAVATKLCTIAADDLVQGINDYQAANGTYPGSYAQLVPAYVPADLTPLINFSTTLLPPGFTWNGSCFQAAALLGDLPSNPMVLMCRDADAAFQGPFQDAMGRFTAANGRYPESMDELVPAYLAALPATNMLEWWPDGTGATQGFVDWGPWCAITGGLGDP